MKTSFAAMMHQRPPSPTKNSKRSATSRRNYQYVFSDENQNYQEYANQNHNIKPVPDSCTQRDGYFANFKDVKSIGQSHTRDSVIDSELRNI